MRFLFSDGMPDKSIFQPSCQFQKYLLGRILLFVRIKLAVNYERRCGIYLECKLKNFANARPIISWGSRKECNENYSILVLSSCITLRKSNREVTIKSKSHKTILIACFHRQKRHSYKPCQNFINLCWHIILNKANLYLYILSGPGKNCETGKGIRGGPGR